MSSEKKIGLVVIGVLVVTLIIVAVVRLRTRYHRSEPVAAATEAAPVTNEPPRLATASSMLDRLAAEPSRVQLAVAESDSLPETDRPSPFSTPIASGPAIPASMEAPPAEPTRLAEAAAPVPPYAAAVSSIGDRYATPSVGAPEASAPESAAIAGGPPTSSDPSAAADPFHHHPHNPQHAHDSAGPALQPADEGVRLIPNPHEAAMTPSNNEPANHNPAHHNQGAGATLLGVEPDSAMHAAGDSRDQQPTAEQTAGTLDPYRYPQASHAVHGAATHGNPTGSHQNAGEQRQPTSTDPRYSNDRYPPATATPHAQANTPHYDIYGRDVPAEADPPVAQHYAPPEHHQPAVETARNTPDRPRELREDPLGRRTHADASYTIQPNDSFWTISERVYGSGAYFKALEEHNREQTPYSDRLRVGSTITTPSVAQLEEKYPDLCPRRRTTPAPRSSTTHASLQNVGSGRVYTVQQGDTLFDIARNELGKASRWAEIYEVNRDRLHDDFDYLAPGTQLRIPDHRAAETPQGREPLTTQAHPPYTR